LSAACELHQQICRVSAFSPKRSIAEDRILRTLLSTFPPQMCLVNSDRNGTSNAVIAAEDMGMDAILLFLRTIAG
jgi:hypothetical protein